MKKILFVVSHRRNRAPNQRFRFEQYISVLEKNGFECAFSPLIKTAKEDALFYSKGNLLRKLPLGIKLACRRIRDVMRARQFDVIFIAREAFVVGYPFFEKIFAFSRAKIVFDFDDSIWMNVVSTNNKFFSWLKSGSKTASIIRLSNLVLAGNQYLADYAGKYNNNVKVFPTTIDTHQYLPKYNPCKDTITIGWSGSFSTIEHFKLAIPALTEIKKKYGALVNFLVIGDKRYKNIELEINSIDWSKDSEIEHLYEIDIGIMPLPNDEWAKGKCGLKGLQYMALGIPTIMSPVGVNSQIIHDGKNGFLADDINEWVEKISILIENPKLRSELGKAGRNTVQLGYSVESQQEKYIKLFQSLVSEPS